MVPSPDSPPPSVGVPPLVSPGLVTIGWRASRRLFVNLGAVRVMSIGGPAPFVHRFAAALARELSDGSVLSRAQVVAVSKEQLSEIPVLIAGRSNPPRAWAVTSGRFARAGADRELRRTNCAGSAQLVRKRYRTSTACQRIRCVQVNLLHYLPISRDVLSKLVFPVSWETKQVYIYYFTNRWAYCWC